MSTQSGGNSVTLFDSGPCINLFRAPTDNDNGAVTTVFDPHAVKLWMRVGVWVLSMMGHIPQSFAARWRAHGLDHMIPRNVKVECYGPDVGYTWEGQSVGVINVKYKLCGARNVEVPCHIDYMLMPDEIAVVHRADVSQLSTVPRV